LYAVLEQTDWRGIAFIGAEYQLLVKASPYIASGTAQYANAVDSKEAEVHSFLLECHLFNNLKVNMGNNNSVDDSSVYQRTAFGKEMLKHFLFDPTFKNLNHGT
jgi:hypothetical protein